MVSNMDYLSSYTATLLEQSRFYFPPLAAMRNALQEARPPVGLPNDGTPAANMAASLAPFMELGLLHGPGGPREREIPLDLSTKTIRQTPDSTADDDVIILEHRRNSARNHMDQMAAYVAAGKMALANKFALSLQAQGPRLGDPFMFSNNLLQPAPPPSGATSQVDYRCPQGQQGGAFLTPHAAICGGLNGFCLDPHRCRMASLSMVASSSPNVARHQAAIFQGSAAAAAIYERHMAKLLPNAAQEFVGTSTRNGFSNMTPGAATTTSSAATSSDMLKNPFQTNGAEGYLAPFPVPGLTSSFHGHHHHNHSHPKEVPTSCSCYLPKPYPMPCACCYPAAAQPLRGYEVQPEGNIFQCCPRPDSVAAFPPETKDKSKREQTSGATTPVGGRSHHSSGKHGCRNAPKTVTTPTSNTPAKDGALQSEHRPLSPSKPQPEGGRWIAHPHSHKEKTGQMRGSSCPEVSPGGDKSKTVNVHLVSSDAQASSKDASQSKTPDKSAPPWTPERTPTLIPKAEPNIPSSTPVDKTGTSCTAHQSELPVQSPTAAVKIEVEGPEKVLQKPNIDRWMLTPPSVVKTETETVSGSKLTTYLMAPQSWNSVGQDGHLGNAWDHQTFVPETTSGIVTPVAVKKSSLTVGLPASPAEGCAPISVEQKAESVTDRDAMLGGKIPQFSPEAVALQTVGGNLGNLDQPWTMPVKRPASELGLVQPKKKRKKDVIVISMREEHQGNRINQVLMKSVKRQLLNDETMNGFSERTSQPEDKLTSVSSVLAPSSDRPQQLHSHLKFLAIGRPHVVEKQKLCGKSHENGASVSPNSSFYASPNVAEARLPPVGVTLVKTPNGANQYKSSMLSGNNEDTSAMLRLYYEQQKQRLQNSYNNQRSIKEQVLSSTEVRSPIVAASSSAPTNATFAPSAKRKRAQSKSRQLHHHHKRSYDGAVHASIGKDGTLTQQLLQQQRRLQPTFCKQDVEEDAGDGDDEREDDNEEDEEQGKCRDATKCGQNKDDEINRVEANSFHSKEHRGTVNENIENEKNANNHIMSPSSMEPTSPATSLDTPSILVTAVASRVESTKRLMINKALGETMLHRAARLGYLDVLSYCLETQAISVDARDNAGYTPLHECCSRGHLEIARQLLQHGADPNASAAGGIRPIHDAIENDQLELVRLLLSYGADPVIATYSGLTPVKIARSQIMLEFLKGYLADVNGESDASILPWQFRGSTALFDPWPTGYDPLLELPSEDESCCDVNGDDDDVDNGAALIFEVSDKPHIPTYRVPTSRRNGSGIRSFCLLQDVLNQTAMDRDAFLSCYPDIQVETMPCHEFESRAKCTQLLVDVSAALEACPASPWVELVYWDDTLRDILDIERVAIPRIED